MRSILKILLTSIGALVLPTSGYASPVPDYSCPGANLVTAKLLKNGGLGEAIYKLTDQTMGLVGHSQQKQQLQLDSASGEGSSYTGLGLQFFESASGDHALIIQATGQRIPCKSAKVLSNVTDSNGKN